MEREVIGDQVCFPKRSTSFVKNISPKHHLLHLLVLSQTIFTNGSFSAFIAEFISQDKTTLHRFPFPQIDACFPKVQIVMVSNKDFLL